MNTKSVNIDSVGEIVLTRRKGSSRISLRIKSDGKVHVSHPWYASRNEIFNFITTNTNWIEKQQLKIKNQKSYFEINQEIKTRNHIIKIVPIEKGKLRGVSKNQKLVITIPSDEKIKSQRVQDFIKLVISEVCRIEAKQYLPQQTLLLADKHQFSFNKVFIKNLKSKWGSCSSMGNINLNLHLMRLPDHLIDYIILHELTHTKEMNHGPNFWQLLNKVTNGNAKQLDKEMKGKSQLILK